MTRSARQQIPSVDSCATMLFGSVARADSGPGSDIDILVATDQGIIPSSLSNFEQPFGNDCTAVSLASYSFRSLLSMAQRGSLFLLHLQVEGRLLSDPTRRLTTILALPNRIRYEDQREILRKRSSVLYASDIEWTDTSCRVARHLLRSAAFLECARRRYPAFSLEAAAVELRDSRLSSVSSENLGGTSRDLTVLRAVIADYVGIPTHSNKTLLSLTQKAETAALAYDVLRQSSVLAYDSWSGTIQPMYTAA